MPPLRDGVCAVHGAFELAAANRLAWWFWQQYHLTQTVALQTPDGWRQCHKLDYPAVRAVFDMHALPPETQADTLERLQILFNVSLNAK